MTSSIQPGFSSLIGEMSDKFTSDGSNMVTKLLEEYAVKFAKGAAAGKTATTLMGVASAGLLEVELPIAAIATFIGEGFDYFSTTVMKDDYKPGDVCLYFAGYWPVTPEEEAGMMMEYVDESFEPLANVPKYDICVVVERLEGEKGYIVYDMAKKSNHTVLAKDLRPEEGNSISKFPLIQKLKEKFTAYVKPFLHATTSFKVGQFVYVTSREGDPDMEGTIVSMNSTSIWIKGSTGGDIFELKKEDWGKLLTSDEIEGKRNISEHGRSNFRVQQLCYYHEYPKYWRPCIIIQLKPECLIRTFNSRDPIKVDATKLLRMSSVQKTKLFHSHDYRKFIEMALQNGFNQDIPLVTNPEMLAVQMEDDRTGTPGETTWEEDMLEIIPASIETRQYGSGKKGEAPNLQWKDGGWVSGVARQKAELVPSYGPIAPQITQGVVIRSEGPGFGPSRPPRAQTTAKPYSGLTAVSNAPQLTQHPGVTTINEPIPPKTGSGMMLAVGAAVVVLGGILIFNK